MIYRHPQIYKNNKKKIQQQNKKITKKQTLTSAAISSSLNVMSDRFAMDMSQSSVKYKRRKKKNIHKKAIHKKAKCCKTIKLLQVYKRTYEIIAKA